MPEKDFKIAIIKKQVKDIASSAVNRHHLQLNLLPLYCVLLHPHAMADPSEVSYLTTHLMISQYFFIREDLWRSLGISIREWERNATYLVAMEHQT